MGFHKKLRRLLRCISYGHLICCKKILGIGRVYNFGNVLINMDVVVKLCVSLMLLGLIQIVFAAHAGYAGGSGWQATDGRWGVAPFLRVSKKTLTGLNLGGNE